MDLNGKVVVFPHDETSVNIIDVATGEVLQQHDAEGTIYVGASVQKNTAAMAVSTPQHGVHVMDLVSGRVLFKLTLPNGDDARVALSKDTLTLGMGTSNGMCC